MQRELIMKTAGWLLLAVVLWFVGAALVDGVEDVDWSQVRPAPGRIALGVLLFAASMAVAGLSVRLLYRDLGVPLSPPRGMVLYFVPMLGRYVPGKVVSLAGHVVIARRYGIGFAVSATAVGLLTVLGLTASVGVGLIFLVAQPPEIIDPSWIRWFSAAGFTGLAVAVLPGLWFGIFNAGLRVFRREPLSARVEYPTMLRMLAGLSLFALLTVAGQAVATLGCIGLPLDALMLIIGAMCIANVVGFLAVFAPGGIGVREGILLLLLTPTMGPGPAALFTVVLRMVQIAVDALAGGVGLWLLRRDPGADTPAPMAT